MTKRLEPFYTVICTHATGSNPSKDLILHAERFVIRVNN
jgi:hypothetical protein